MHTKVFLMSPSVYFNHKLSLIYIKTGPCLLFGLCHKDGGTVKILRALASLFLVVAIVMGCELMLIVLSVEDFGDQ